jgi:antitoxin HicB
MTSPRAMTVLLDGVAYQALLTDDAAAGGFTVEVPALPGVVTEGDSLAEAVANAAEAIALRLEVHPVPAAESSPASNSR